MITDKWKEKYDLCVEWKSNNPNTLLNINLVYKGIKIGTWYYRQKNIYFYGDALENGCLEHNGTIMNKEKQLLMSELIDETDITYNDWEYNFSLILKWYEENPNKRLRTDTFYFGVNIGKWYSLHKTIIKNGIKKKDNSICYKTFILSHDKVKKIKNLMSKLEKNTAWNDKFILCKEYMLLHDTKNINAGIIYKDVSIGSWFNFQKAIYNNGMLGKDNIIRYGNHRLTLEQVEKLESLDIKWFKQGKRILEKEITKDNQFQIKREILKRFKEYLKDCKTTEEVNFDINFKR
ncbi:MAG: hypothetical protein E7158_00900 [Firmicutes bacterium]|nr:hypothetical protein [Bacillota bacterium]